MERYYMSNIYKKISNKILNNEDIKKDDYYKEIREYFKSDIFLKKLDNIMKNKDFSANNIFELLSEIFKKYDNKNKSFWLNYLYNYILYKSFPHAITIELKKEYNTPALIFTIIFKVFTDYERNNENLPEGRYPLKLISNSNIKKFNILNEYKQFKKSFENNYVYELMKLHQEVTGHTTLNHVTGVHYVAMNVSYQLYNLNLPVDLGIISGAAAGHDIGKFGCKGKELKRVPYLHYYYTELWFKNNNIDYIGHIATNHSTWDLELENLPIESLILIYSDFRVKNKNINGKNKMHIYSLRDSFDIILQKLDNVDVHKENRYKKVYAKLKDFEDYMLNLGVNLEPEVINSESPSSKRFLLMENEEIVDHLKYRAIEHNIFLMNRLESESSLSSILEIARSENDWKKLRGYLNIFEEYSTYFTQRQKEITLDFLYDLLMHKEEDIRKQSAELIGILIAHYDEEYRKEVPENIEVENEKNTSYDLLDKYINLVISPDHKILDTHKIWMGLSLKSIMSSVLSNCNKYQRKEFRNVILSYYSKVGLKNIDTKFFLLQTSSHIPFNSDEEKIIGDMLSFIIDTLSSENDIIKLTSLQKVYNIIFRIDKDSVFVKNVKNYLTNSLDYSNIPSENYLKLKISKRIKMNKNIIDIFYSYYKKDFSKTPDIFLMNLKTATHWAIKKNNIELLLDYIIDNHDKNIIHTAMHFTNLIKVSANENVRNHAGDALLKIFPFLSLDKRNDVTVELLRALEIQGYHFTKYIPNYLGQLILYLQPTELDELIDDFIDKIKSNNRQIQFLILKTVGVAIQNYSNYNDIFSESKSFSNKRFIKLLGILLNGLVNYDIQVSQESFRIIGSEIFGSNILDLEEKNIIFKNIAKKILNLLPTKEESELWFLNNSASLNNIYRFISDYIFINGNIDIKYTKKVAFFPGTFDPFSSSHKMITQEIRDLGFEVYLQVDEFSWSKRTQPHEIRREIINMSIADQLDIYLYPEDLPVNIANDSDLKKLKENFKDKDIYIVVGSDVLLNASSYKKNKTENSIHNFSHIIFDRKGGDYNENNLNDIEKVLKNITSDIIQLKLPSKYQKISSTRIRDYIDANRDISQLIDPLAQNFIYKTGVYKREPQYKILLQTQSISIEIIDDITDELIQNLSSTILKKYDRSYDMLKLIQNKLNPRIILLRDIKKDTIIGFSIFHWIRSSNLFEQFNNNRISEYIRENSVGRIISIDGIYINNNSRFNNLEQILLTETLSFCLSKDYTYGVFRNIIKDYPTKTLNEVLILQGFTKINFSNERDPIYAVKMTNPCTLNLDLESILKPEFSNNKNIRRAIVRTRKRIQRVLTSLYPGQLILSFDRNILHEKMIEKICDLNNVSTQQTTPKKVGEKMCVPFGSILNGNIVPNTVTKSLHTEKMYSPDISDFDIEPFPYYMSLDNQIKMINSFNRPVILVDDLLNKGYRVKAIDPLLKKEDINVEKIIVGILSGRGKELMDIQNRKVDSAYFIPNLRVWFNESAFYPFIGGDTVWRGNNPLRNILPSVNFILPYTSPIFIKGTENKTLYELSKVSLYNAIDLLSTLENEYQKKHGRNLTIKQLSEVFLSSRYPDKGSDIEYDINLKASHYLKNDLEQLKRLEDIIKR
ncbi:cytidyltransferase [Senegalia massiliensis]|uniref:nicotinate-nucleotide adenylyltransferase n=1 Tax=Senegalia massiliensis TaxID=1720316 RepID=A0A845QT50_9CLOT|nr:cytidyltransferase [Senegalia massiliensis]NBI05391.1 cytidyltransferase [Senegalia massiliensis]